MIKANTIITISTPEKKMCDKVLTTLNEKLPEDNRFKIHNSEIMKAEKVEGTKHFTGHLELEIEFKDSKLNGETLSALENLYNFVFEFSPASIEVFEPSKINLDLASFNNSLNTLAGVIVQNASKNKSLEYSLREFCESTLKTLKNGSKPGKKLREIEEQLKKYYLPARK